MRITRKIPAAPQLTEHEKLMQLKRAKPTGRGNAQDGTRLTDLVVRMVEVFGPQTRDQIQKKFVKLGERKVSATPAILLALKDKRLVEIDGMLYLPETAPSPKPNHPTPRVRAIPR